MINTSKINHRSSTDFGARRPEQGRDASATPAISTAKLLLTFDRPVIVRDLPTGVTVNSLPATDYEQTSPTTLLLTYAAPVAAGQSWAIADKEPHLRTRLGGFVAAAGGTFPA